MTRFKAAVFTLLFILPACYFGQKKNFSEPKEHSFGFGMSNVGGVTINRLKKDTSRTNFQYFIEFHEKVDTNTFLRFGISTAFQASKQGTIRHYNLIPFNAFIGIEKTIYKEQININYGLDLFFSMSLRGTQLGHGAWQGDDPGAGISTLAGIDYSISETWSLGSELSIGAGLFKTYQSIGNATRAVLTPKILFLKALSIGVKYRITKA